MHQVVEAVHLTELEQGAMRELISETKQRRKHLEGQVSMPCYVVSCEIAGALAYCRVFNTVASGGDRRGKTDGIEHAARTVFRFQERSRRLH